MTIDNFESKWIFLKVKGTEEAVKLTKVIPNKAVIPPKESATLAFNVKNLKKGETLMKFLIKWTAANLDEQAGSFKNLKNYERFYLVARNDVAYKNAGEKNVENQVNVIMLKFEPYRSEVQFSPAPLPIQKVERKKFKLTFMDKVKIFSTIFAIYAVYNTISAVTDWVLTFKLDFWNFFP